ncbi:MAG: hypothetical protein LCH67_10450 [Bacteroidetes bacterium]|nr:hypothetical protein [Bacteroidota bacterium]
MKPLKLIFLLTMILTILGCNKEEPSVQLLPKISRIVKKNSEFKDYTGATIEKYIYDKSGILTELQLLQGTFQLMNTKFTYHPNNIVTKEIVDFGFSNPSKSSAELIFDSKNRLIKSTETLSFNTKRVQTFEYDTNSKYPKSTTIMDDGKLFLYKELSWKSGNLIEEKEFVNSKSELSDIFQYEYDTHKNLFKSDQNVLYGNSIYSESMYFSENNLIKRVNNYSKDTDIDLTLINN